MAAAGRRLYTRGTPALATSSLLLAIKPRFARMVAKANSYGKATFLHSDGDLTEIIPDLIEIGVDVLNPLEPLPATDWLAIKEQFGKKVCFLGGIDIRTAMNGPVEGVIEEVKKRINIFGDGGGYIMTSTNHLQVDVPPENIVALFDAAREYGRYL